MFLIITRSFPPSVGGMQNLMWGLVKSLSKINLIKVFADYETNHEEFDNSVSFTINRVGGPKLIRKFRKTYLINEYIKKNNNIECVISDHWKSLENIKTLKKKICLIHSKEINHDPGTRLNKRVLDVLNNTDVIISNSNFTKKLAVEKGVNENLIIVINPGIDPIKEIDKKYLEKAEELLKNKTPRLITVARLDKRKNHAKVIMALRNLKEKFPKIIYTCIGNGEEHENIRKLTRQLFLDDQILFLKDIPQGLKNSLISKSDVLVMPSIIHKKSVEGFGIVFIEAAQYGVASIGGKDGGASDAIIHEKTGLICDGNNLDDVYSAIENILENKKYKILGENAKIHSSNFNWSNIIEKYKRIL
tara:strand:+ start:261 stop:1343 length:1083 start_codon:yes stop_codon:yes gene_type:complete